MARLASLPQYSVDDLTLLSKTGVTSGQPWPDGISMDPGDLNSGPHTCVTKHLNTEPFAQPTVSFRTFHEDGTLAYLIYCWI